MLNRGLERVSTAELRVYDDEPYSPVYHDGKADQEGGACQEARIADGVGLANDSSASALD